MDKFCEMKYTIKYEDDMYPGMPDTIVRRPYDRGKPAIKDANGKECILEVGDWAYVYVSDYKGSKGTNHVLSGLDVFKYEPIEGYGKYEYLHPALDNPWAEKPKPVPEGHCNLCRKQEESCDCY